MTWLAVTPSIVVLTLFTLQPRLEADEAREAVARAALAAGTLEPEQRRIILTEWAGEDPNPAPAKANPDVLAQRGIPVRRVYREKPGA
jgi:hypothetical protein